MHQPRPYALYGEVHSEEDAAAVELLVRRLTNIKRSGSLDSLRLVRALPGGGVALAQDMGGVLKVVVRQPEQDPLPEQPRVLRPHTEIPMLFSGVVERAVFQGRQGVQLRLTQEARRRLGGYGDQLGPAAPSLQRFAIEYADRHAEFRPRQPGRWHHSQYVQLRPTWFSGRMASVVQVAGGYGRQDFDDLPDDQVERAQMKLPHRVQAQVELQLDKALLPGYSGFPPESGQIQFDYKFHETHGVAFDTDRKPWLVRINSRGVFAMPLPMVPATTTQAFREYIEEQGDSEIEWLLDTFGGMPSGEGFPVGATAFEAWRRAGVIIKVCDTADFYSAHMGYSSAMGWSFNNAGTEAVNTCYQFDDADGLQVGRTYKLSLRLGPMTPEPHLDLEAVGEHGAVVDHYVRGVLENLPRNAAGQAVRFKLRRTPMADLVERARANYFTNADWGAEIEYWDSLESQPIASHGGSVARTAEGNVWARGRPRVHPQIKFPEPLSDPPGCLSHDFGQLEGYPPVPAEMVVRCDTIMHAYFAGNDLRVVKYFLDSREFVQDVEHDYDDCMQVGSWLRTEHAGQLSLHGRFYASDIDAREAFAPRTTVTKTVGTDLGYDHTPHFSFDHFFARPGSIWRNRYFKHEIDEEVSEGKSRTIAVCVPFLARNAAFHAQRTSTSGGSRRTARQLYHTTDPNTYRYFTYDFVWAWVGGDTSGNMASVKSVEPSPKDGNPVWVVGYNYNPGPCTDFADQGDWMGGLPRDYTWLVHPNKNEWRHSGGGGPPNIRQFSETVHEPGKTEGLLHLSFTERLQEVNKDPRQGFFLPSPNASGDIFYTDAIMNAAGKAEYASCAEADPEAPKQRKRWGFTRLADHKSAHHFIGVINE